VEQREAWSESAIRVSTGAVIDFQEGEMRNACGETGAHYSGGPLVIGYLRFRKARDLPWICGGKTRTLRHIKNTSEK
jgi:hypothetical protein